MNYTSTREVFTKFKTGLQEQSEVLDELLKALGMLVSEYDTSVRENRFITGGATERLLAAAMRAVGIGDARARGLEQHDEDIMVNSVRLSVKASYTGRRDRIRLVNTMGSNHASAWRVGTILVLAQRGIGYVDPTLLPSTAVHTTGDALVLSRIPIDQLHDAEPQWLLPCAVPTKSHDASQRRAASEAVASEILRRTRGGQGLFPRLLAHH